MTSNISLTTKPAALDPSKKWVTGAAVLRHSPNTPIRVLVCKRVAHEESFAGLWEIPGGHIEATDLDVEHALARELSEETGLELSGVVKRLDDMTWVGCSGTMSVQLNYVVEVERDEVVTLCADERDEYRWVRQENTETLQMSHEMRKVVRSAFLA